MRPYAVWRGRRRRPGGFVAVRAPGRVPRKQHPPSPSLVTSSILRRPFPFRGRQPPIVSTHPPTPLRHHASLPLHRPLPAASISPLRLSRLQLPCALSIEAWLPRVLILHVRHPYRHCYTNTATALSPNKHPNTSINTHHGAHALATPSPAHPARAAPWRQLRAVFTAPLQQSGGPTRQYSPSPRAVQSTGPARRDAHRGEQIVRQARNHLRSLAAILARFAPATPLTALDPSRALGIQPAPLRLGPRPPVCKPAPPVDNNGSRHATNSGQDASQAPHRRHELDCARLVPHQPALHH